MMHPLAGVFLVTEESYRRERAIAHFAPFRRRRGDELDQDIAATSGASTALPRQRSAAGAAAGPSRQETAHHQHAA